MKDIQGTWMGGSGSNPGDLGKDLRNRNNSKNRKNNSSKDKSDKNDDGNNKKVKQ